MTLHHRRFIERNSAATWAKKRFNRIAKSTKTALIIIMMINSFATCSLNMTKLRNFKLCNIEFTMIFIIIHSKERSSGLIKIRHASVHQIGRCLVGHLNEHQYTITSTHPNKFRAIEIRIFLLMRILKISNKKIVKRGIRMKGHGHRETGFQFVEETLWCEILRAFCISPISNLFAKVCLDVGEIVYLMQIKRISRWASIRLSLIKQIR